MDGGGEAFGDERRAERDQKVVKKKLPNFKAGDPLSGPFQRGGGTGSGLLRDGQKSPLAFC